MSALQFDPRISEEQARLAVDVVRNNLVGIETDASHGGELVGQFLVSKNIYLHKEVPACILRSHELGEYSIEMLQQLRGVFKAVSIRRHHVLRIGSDGTSTGEVEDRVYAGDPHENEAVLLRSDGYAFDWSCLGLSGEEHDAFAVKYEAYIGRRAEEERLQPLQERSMQVMHRFITDLTSGAVRLRQVNEPLLAL